MGITAVGLAHHSLVWFRYPDITTGEIWGAGLGAAVLSGGTAALAAWGVVKGTARAVTRQGLRDRAEDALIAFAVFVSRAPEFGGLDSEKDDVLARLVIQANALAGVSLAASLAVGRLDAQMAAVIEGRTTEMAACYDALATAIIGKKGPTAARLLREGGRTSAEIGLDIKRWVTEGTVRTRYRMVDEANRTFERVAPKAPHDDSRS